ncbi:hypothetical protein K438DRAFT_1967215 [Mycena galopus ATCC 62051]|nr:hypothetical protein K438DRAFT_1967215 [Mycena galopus ATCC 62051]
MSDFPTALYPRARLPPLALHLFPRTHTATATPAVRIPPTRLCIPALSSVDHDTQRLAENYSSFLRRRRTTYPKVLHGGCRLLYAEGERREEGSNGTLSPICPFSARVRRVVFLTIVPICGSSIATLCMAIAHHHDHSFLPRVESRPFRATGLIRCSQVARRSHPCPYNREPAGRTRLLAPEPLIAPPSAVLRVCSRPSRLCSHSFSFSGSAPRRSRP